MLVLSAKVVALRRVDRTLRFCSFENGRSACLVSSRLRLLFADNGDDTAIPLPTLQIVARCFLTVLNVGPFASAFSGYTVWYRVLFNARDPTSVEYDTDSKVCHPMYDGRDGVVRFWFHPRPIGIYEDAVTYLDRLLASLHKGLTMDGVADYVEEAHQDEDFRIGNKRAHNWFIEDPAGFEQSVRRRLKRR